MKDTTIPVGSVVVGIDGSEAAGHALDWAAAQARYDGRALVLAHAIPPLTGTWLDTEGRENRVGLNGRRLEDVELLDLARERAQDQVPGLDVHEVLRVTEPRTLLAALAGDALMVVVGSRGFGVARNMLLGSVGRSLTRQPACPVVVHRPRPFDAASSELLVGVDGSARSVPVLEFAFELADHRGLAVRLLDCVWQTPGVAQGMWTAPDAVTAAAERREVAERVATLTEKFPQVPVVTEVVRGDPQAVLDATSEHQAMVVVGAHHRGLSGLRPLSVTAGVLAHARCPVAVVPVENGGGSDSRRP